MSAHATNRQTPTTEPERYITVKEAAAFLSIPVNSCYKLCLSRTVPSYKLGKTRRVKLSELINVMESARVEARKR